MAGIGDLISVLMQGGMSNSGTDRVGNAMNAIAGCPSPKPHPGGSVP